MFNAVKNIVKYIYHDLPYRLNRVLYSPPMIVDSARTIEKISTDKASFARFGDGELNLIIHRSIDFQRSSKEISCRLDQILRNNDERFMVGLPDTFRNRPDLNEKAQKFWVSYNKEHWADWGKRINRSHIYYDTNATRFYLSYRDKSCSKTLLELWKRVWNARELLIVEGENSCLGVGNDLFCNSKSKRRIICPSINAFDVYSDILAATIKFAKKSDLILIALGPTATVLAFDLYTAGYQAIDVGHIDIEYEWMCMEAKEKVAVKGKYTNEVEGDKVVGIIQSEEYEQEIIYKVSCQSSR